MNPEKRNYIHNEEESEIDENSLNQLAMVDMRAALEKSYYYISNHCRSLCIKFNHRQYENELVQEVFKKALTYQNTFLGKNFYKWIERIASNALIDEHKNQKKLLYVKNHNEKRSASEDPNPEEIFFKKDQEARIEKLISKLSPREKIILEMRLAGKKYEQIASELNISLSTIGNYIGRIKAKAKKQTD